MSEQVPSIGRVVHYVLEAGPHQGERRPALIVQVWGVIRLWRSSTSRCLSTGRMTTTRIRGRSR